MDIEEHLMGSIQAKTDFHHASPAAENLVIFTQNGH
jgi:hypothetical protein